MTAFPSRRRNRTMVAASTGLAVLLLGALLGWSGWHVLKNSKAGTEAAALTEIAFPSTPTAMVAVVDEDRVVVSLAVLVLAPSAAQGQPARGGTLVSIPTNADRAQSVDEASAPIANSLADFGEEGLRGDVESLTRVTINTEAVLDVSTLAAVLDQVGPIRATLPNDVVTVTASGATETLFVAGDTELSPADAAQVLVARDPALPEGRRLPDVRAVWSAISAKIGPGLAPASALGPVVRGFDDFLAHFVAGPVQVFNDLTATQLTGSANPDQLDVGSLDVARVVLLMASLAPSAMITPMPTLNFRIENGATQADVEAAGLVGVTPADVTLDLVSRLLFLKGNVVSVAPTVYTLTSKAVPETTVVFSPGGLEPAELEAVTNSLGELEVRSPPFAFPLVDVVIVVGRSYLLDMARVQAGVRPPADTSVLPADTTSVGDSSSSATVTT